jgi:pyridoxamine 5'-phosphate oxidase
MHWQPLGRQVRIEGRVTLVSAEEADAYWISRPRESQLGGAASDQSAPIASRAALLHKWRTLDRRYRNEPVPRPPHWTGFRVAPATIEFWTLRPYRMHDRELFTRTRGGWRVTRLQP